MTDDEITFACEQLHQRGKLRLAQLLTRDVPINWYQVAQYITEKQRHVFKNSLDNCV